MNAITSTAEAAAIATSEGRLGLFFDTETTGLPNWHEPSEHPSQPHIVQLAAQLVDLDSRIVIDQMDCIIRPAGWVIPPEVAAIHGITTERAHDEGIPEEEALERFWAMWAFRHRIAHNEQFDARILRIGLKRYFDVRDPALELQPSDQWKAGSVECTQKLMTKVCNLPPTDKMRAARRNYPKAPKLVEAFEHAFGRPMEGAHNAMADVEGCKAVYFWFKDQQKVAA